VFEKEEIGIFDVRGSVHHSTIHK